MFQDNFQFENRFLNIEICHPQLIFFGITKEMSVDFQRYRFIFSEEGLINLQFPGNLVEKDFHSSARAYKNQTSN